MIKIFDPEFIFSDNRPFAQCHASTLTCLDDGTIVAAWFGGTREGHDDVSIWGAKRENGTWTEPAIFAKVDDVPHWNPVLFTDNTENVHLYFKVGKTIPRWVTWVAHMNASGRQLHTPRPLVAQGEGGRGPVKNKPITLSNGDILAPASVETPSSWDAFTDRMKNRGDTWEASPFIPVNHSSFPGKGIIQPTLWESEEGHVHMLTRSTCGRICRSDSSDYGRTWSAAYPTTLPNNNSGIDLARLADGTLVLVYNPVEGDWAARTPLSISISVDNGEIWSEPVPLENGPGEYSYPSVIPIESGIAVTYTWRRERIAFRTVLI